MSEILSDLGDVLEARKSADPASSYVASLHRKGLNKILEKIGEEAVEMVIAAKDAEHSSDHSNLVYETADLWFHCMVALSHLDVRPEEVLHELARRFDLSGLEEKRQRSK